MRNILTGLTALLLGVVGTSSMAGAQTLNMMRSIDRIDPATLLNQFGLHDREMSCCASEADPAQFPPESECFT